MYVAGSYIFEEQSLVDRELTVLILHSGPAEMRLDSAWPTEFRIGGEYHRVVSEFCLLCCVLYVR